MFGAWVKFWQDAWCVDAALGSLFPELYQISANNRAMVSEYLNVKGGGAHWNPVFVQSMQNWELKVFNKILNSCILNGFRMGWWTKVMPKFVLMLLQGWRRKLNTFRYRALSSSVLDVYFVEGEEWKDFLGAGVAVNEE
uniref:Reverse transcriptase zinc-binding domain-containing protein n=1 Tax=Fagus sylvatica TaxID=28930 RepID=A0A2N9ISQ0_FAGSY